VELGASTEVAPDDLAIAAVGRGERPDSRLPAELDPDAQEVLILTALEGREDLVLSLVGIGFRGFVGGGPEGTLLHHAAWVGNPGVVGRLLAAGADATATSFATYSTSLAWAALGSQHHRVEAATMSPSPSCSPTRGPRSSRASSTWLKAPSSGGSRSGASARACAQ